MGGSYTSRASVSSSMGNMIPFGSESLRCLWSRTGLIGKGGSERGTTWEGGKEKG